MGTSEKDQNTYVNVNPITEAAEELKKEETQNDHYDRSEKSNSDDDYVQTESLDDVDNYEHIEEESDESSHYDKDPTIENTDQDESATKS